MFGILRDTWFYRKLKGLKTENKPYVLQERTRHKNLRTNVKQGFLYTRTIDPVCTVSEETKSIKLCFLEINFENIPLSNDVLYLR